MRIQCCQILDSPLLPPGLDTETDSNGRYELRGIPDGQGSVIQILPRADQSYLVRQVHVVPERSGLSPVTVDVQLHHAVWIQGRVTDKSTGRPVGGALVKYRPLLSNPFTFELPEFDRTDGRRRMDDLQRYCTDGEGRFRIPGVPGPAIIGVLALGGNYLKGVGAADVKARVSKWGGYDTYFDSPSAQRQNAIKEIDPPADATAVACDFVLAPGESIHLNIVDAEGRPVRGSLGLNIREAGLDGSDMQMDAACEVRSLAPDETRHVWILNRERKLGRYFDIKAGSSPREMTVKLEPCATLTGRVVDAEGAAVEGVVVNAHAQDLQPNSINAVQTGADGRFSHPYLPGGCQYEFDFLKPMTGGGGMRVHQLKGIQLEAGKSKDLGEIKLSKRD